MDLLRLILLPLRLVAVSLYIIGRVGLIGFGIVMMIIFALAAFVVVGLGA